MGKNRKALLVTNPRAGRMRGMSAAPIISRMLGEHGYDVEIFTTDMPKEATDIAAKYAGKKDLVVCCGGDGTFTEVLSGLMSLPRTIPIGYVPVGTTNDLARTLRIPKKIDRAVRVILYGAPIPYDIGRFNDSAYFSYIASFGAFTKASYATPQWMKNRFGRLAYFIDGIKSVGEIHPYAVKIRADDFRENGLFLFGSVSNSTSVGGVCQFESRDVGLNDGKFEVLLVRNPQNPADLRNILFGLRHRKYDARYICFLHARHVEMEFERDVAWTTDGEFAGVHRTVCIENLHNAINIYYPENGKAATTLQLSEP